MKNKRTILISIAIILMFILVFIYWLWSKEDDSKEHILLETTKEKTIIKELNLGISNFDTLNPIDSNNKMVQGITKIIYDSLFDINKDKKLEKNLISEYSKINPTTYLFKLKDDIYWHNGKKLTSNDIKYTLEYILENENSVYAPNIDNIQNIRIIDNTTFKINVLEEKDFFEYNLTFPIICEEPNIGTGLFKIDKINETSIELKTYNYQNEQEQQEQQEQTSQGTNNSQEEKSKTILEKINIHLYKEISELYNEFKLGKIDVITTDILNYNEVIGEVGYNKKEYPGRQYMYAILNPKTKQLQDKEVKKAILYSINKQEISKKFTAISTDSPPSLHFGDVHQSEVYAGINDLGSGIEATKNDEKNSIKYDLDKAIESLEKAGFKFNNNVWVKNNKELIINILINEKELTKLEIAYIIKQQLEKIGIKVEVNITNEEQYQENIIKGNYDILIKEKYIGVIPTIEDTPFMSLFFNKEVMLYSNNLYGEINPNWYNSFYGIETWKKII